MEDGHNPLSTLIVTRCRRISVQRDYKVLKLLSVLVDLWLEVTLTPRYI